MRRLPNKNPTTALQLQTLHGRPICTSDLKSRSGTPRRVEFLRHAEPIPVHVKSSASQVLLMLISKLDTLTSACQLIQTPEWPPYIV